MNNDSRADSVARIIIRHHYLLRQLITKDFRGKYAGSFLGLFWSVINPLLQLGIYTFLVTVIFRVRFGLDENSASSALYILAGLLPWIAIQEAVHRSTTVLVDQSNLVTRAHFPAELLPMSIVFSSFLSELVGVLILILISVASGYLHVSVFYLVIIFIIQLALTIGLSLLFAGVAVLFRDLFQIVPVLLMIWLYATPVIYPADLIPDNYQFIIALNPMTHIVEAYRRVLLEGAGLPAGMLYVAVVSIFMLWFGRRTFERLRPNWADVL